MRGDFSRIRFNPAKQYTAVLQQQGRVSLDADANEQAAIGEYLSRNEIIDVIGPFGAPEHDAGFAISISGNELLIGDGRYYVEGLVCENRTPDLPYASQPYLLYPSPTDATLLSELMQAGGSSVLQVFLQVWQRVATPLDDACLREPALGQADTTLRLETVWRVVASLVPPAPPPKRPFPRPPIRTIFGGTLLQARRSLADFLKARLPVAEVSGVPTSTVGEPAPSPTDSGVDCCQAMYAATSTVSTGTMSASTATSGTDCSCQPIPAAGYQGLENQLYRVEIHQGGTEATATFKWSRENGSLVSLIESVSGNTIVVDSLGPDANLGFAVDQWVEISDDTDLFGETPNAPGQLYQIQSTDATIPAITLTSPVTGVDCSRNARVRRWDQVGDTASPSGVPLSAGSQLPIENGIQISFRAGIYQSGDYWTIPARTATGKLEWPPCGSDGQLFQPPQSVTIYNAPLACIHWDPKQQAATVEDCRRIFSPLTELSVPASHNALHVKAINWTNDSLMTADVWVANGLAITLDAPPTSPISNADFVVTLETIFDPFTSAGTISRNSFRAFQPKLPSTYIRTCFALDSPIAVDGTTIYWTLPYNQTSPLQIFTVNSINAGLLFGAYLGQYARVRVRLLGNTISSGSGTNQIFLDGRALGAPAQNADGTSRMDLQLPSGAGEQSSDFESWFYLAPTLLINALNAAYPALYTIVDGNGNVTAVSNVPATPNGNGPAVNPFLTIDANYRALHDTQVTLTVLDDSGAPSTYAQIESPITIHAGESSVNAAISVLKNPLTDGKPITVTITIQASIATAVGPIPSTPVTFTLTGLVPPIIIQ